MPTAPRFPFRHDLKRNTEHVGTALNRVTQLEFRPMRCLWFLQLRQAEDGHERFIVNRLQFTIQNQCSIPSYYENRKILVENPDNKKLREEIIMPI